jgi:hypothetical protein
MKASWSESGIHTAPTRATTSPAMRAGGWTASRAFTVGCPAARFGKLCRLGLGFNPW